jgi:uncharacterized protein (DUF433 family)
MLRGRFIVGSVKIHYLADMETDDHIGIDPEIMGGTPCVKGTRITVYAIEARVTGGGPIEDVLADYPYITRAQIEAAVDYARRVPFEEDPEGRPWRRHKLPTAAE